MPALNSTQRVNKYSVNNFSLIPYKQCEKEPKIELIQDKQKETFLNKINDYSEIIKDSNLLEEKWMEFCDSRKQEYLSSLLSLGKFRKQSLKTEKLSKLVLKRKRLMSLLNLIRCETHRDCILNNIEKYLKKK